MRNTFIGKSALDDQFLAAFDLPAGAKTVSSEIYTDLQATYQVHKNWSLYAGIDNVFDQSGTAISSLPGSVTGVEMAGSYDAIGRRYYLGVRGRL